MECRMSEAEGNRMVGIIVRFMSENEETAMT